MVQTHLQHIVVIGQGYVGLPLSVAAFSAGNRVTGIDVDLRKVSLLGSGTSVVEDVPSSVVASAIASGHYLPSSDYNDASGFDVAVITVPTPLRAGEPDLSFIESAGAS